LSSSQEREKEMVECVVGFGLVGAALCPSTGLAQSATHSLMSKVMKSAPEVVHTLAPVSAPKHIVSPDSKESLQPADAGAEAQPSAVSVSADSSEAVEVPIDCACCHSKCQKSGLYKDPKMKSIPHSFWCVKQVRNIGIETLTYAFTDYSILLQGQVGSPSYCPAQDYNCLCCDRVRVQLRGQSCA
jgi:hypothetical protein